MSKRNPSGYTDTEEALRWLVIVIGLVLITYAVMHGGGIDPNAGQHM